MRKPPKDSPKITEHEQMAFLQCNFHSDALGMAASMNVILPQKSRTQIGMGGAEAAAEGAPVLYLLHGLSDDHTIWMRRTSIERYAATTGLVVVMPSVNRSFYNNTPDGMRFWDYISEELPALLPTFFHVSTRREDTFVAGLSMGGFGAFKLALNHPDRYAAAASLSGALRNDWLCAANRKLYEFDFGPLDQIPGSQNDLYTLAAKVVESDGPRPALFQACGTEDMLYQVNTEFRAHLRRIGYESTYMEGPGNHCWEYWDARIQDVLNWLPLKDRK